MDDQNNNPANPPLNPLPDQGQANVSNPAPLPPVDPVVSTPPPTPDVSFPSEDSGPLPLTNAMPPSPDGTASPAPEEPSMIPPSKPKLGLGKGRVVATILGILLLVGGVGAGIVLVQQQQDIREKAATCSSGSTRCKNSTTIEVCAGNIWNASSCGTGKACSNGQCVATSGDGGPGGQNGNGAADTANTGGGGEDSGGGKLPACPSSGIGYSCSSSSITGAICMRNTDYCCPIGKSPVNGACATSTSCQTGQTRCKDTSTIEVCQANTWTSSACGTNKKCTNGQCVAADGTPGGYCNCNSVKGESPSCASDQTCVVNGTYFEGSFVNCVTSGSINGLCKTPAATSPDTPPKVDTSPTTAPTNPPGGETIAQCTSVKIYDTDWIQLTTVQLSALSAGDAIRLAISGTTTSGTIDKAQFTVNGVALPETTAKKPGGSEFYSEYVIPAGVTSFTISGKIHHSTLGWF
jgi:hypothetical protein